MNAALIMMLIALTAALAICIMRLILLDKACLRLSEQLNRFLNGEVQTPEFSVRDNRFALFENSVVELENSLLQSRENEREESRRTAQLLADVSHQFKTPLAGLRLYCELDAAPHQKESIQLIEHMEKLIYSLLRLEKLRAGAYDLNFRMLNLEEVAREAAWEVGMLFPERKIQIKGQALARCDGYWMGEALMNLLKNACEHTGQHGEIVVEIQKVEGGVLIQVSDNGGGVEEAALPHLFRRFSRASANEKTGGVGLGLAIVRAVAQQHHGSVSAANTGGGLCVSMYLPAFYAHLKKT